MERCGKISTVQFNRNARYNHSAKGIARNERYNHSEKRRVCTERFYTKVGGAAAYNRMKRMRLSEEMGCSQDEVDSLLPALRFMEALQGFHRENG